MSFESQLRWMARLLEREERWKKKLATKRWERQQLAVAELLGGESQPDTGKPGPDVVAHPFAVELKTTNKLPQWLTGAMEQARHNAQLGLCPLVVLAEVRQGQRAKRYALLRLEDLTTLVAATVEPEAPSGEKKKV